MAINFINSVWKSGLWMTKFTWRKTKCISIDAQFAVEMFSMLLSKKKHKLQNSMKAKAIHFLVTILYLGMKLINAYKFNLQEDDLWFRMIYKLKLQEFREWLVVCMAVLPRL